MSTLTRLWRTVTEIFLYSLAYVSVTVSVCARPPPLTKQNMICTDMKFGTHTPFDYFLKGFFGFF